MENALVPKFDTSLFVKESSGKDIVHASLWLSLLISYAKVKLAILSILQRQHTAQQWANISLCQSGEKHTYTHKKQTEERGDKGKEGGLKCGRVGETQTTGERRGK